MLPQVAQYTSGERSAQTFCHCQRGVSCMTLQLDIKFEAEKTAHKKLSLRTRKVHAIHGSRNSKKSYWIHSDSKSKNLETEYIKIGADNNIGYQRSASVVVVHMLKKNQVVEQ